MARVTEDGGEFQDTVYWDLTDSVVVANTSPAPFVAGTYYYKNGGTAGTRYTMKYVPSMSEGYLRVRLNHSIWGTNDKIIVFRNEGTDIMYIWGDAAQHWVVATPDGTLVDTGVVRTASQWYLVEFYYKIANSGGRAVLKVDGNTIADFTGDTQYSSYTTFNNFGMHRSTGTICWDDFALNDTSGTVDNSWCGDGFYGMIYPNAAGDANEMLNSGSAAQSTNYTYVDEFPKDDDTTYVYCSASATGTKDKYNLTSFSATGKTIKRIYSEARVKRTVPDTSAIKIGYLPSGGTDQLTTASTLSLTYTRIIGTSASVNPVTQLEWGQSDLDSLQYVTEMA